MLSLSHEDLQLVLFALDQARAHNPAKAEKMDELSSRLARFVAEVCTEQNESEGGLNQ